MTETTAEGVQVQRPRGRRNGRADPESLERAKTAAHEAIEEVWTQFQAAIHETSGEEPASITVALRYKPGKETERTSTPPRVEVVGKASLPTNKQTFAARDSGGQLVFSAWSE